MTRTTLGLAIGLVGCLAVAAQAAKFEVQQEPDGVTIKLDGKLLTRYVIKSGDQAHFVADHRAVRGRRHPPVSDGRGAARREIGPSAPTLVLVHPRRRERRSASGSKARQAGQIVHKEFLKVSGGETAVISTRNEWIALDGKKMCEDVRTLTFGTCGESVWIDFDSTVTATDGPVKFVDTKEGSFGVRVAGSMGVDTKKGGQIVNSDGLTDKDAWGKQAPWVDYHGPVNEQDGRDRDPESSDQLPVPHVLACAHLRAVHRQSVRRPATLRAARATATTRCRPGESFTLRYRVLIHKGDEKEGKVAEAYEAYAKTAKP